LVPVQKGPVEPCDRAVFGRIEAAAFAIVAHFVYVG
jgi:hypothetical protein